jgi:hypothetical protein
VPATELESPAGFHRNHAEAGHSVTELADELGCALTGLAAEKTGQGSCTARLSAEHTHKRRPRSIGGHVEVLTVLVNEGKFTHRDALKLVHGGVRVQRPARRAGISPLALPPLSEGSTEESVLASICERDILWLGEAVRWDPSAAESFILNLR